MNGLIKYFLNRPLLVNLISVVIFLSGITSVILLKKDLYPEVDFDVIMVNTVYPGSSPEDVEKLVTISLERELKAVNGIEEMNAMSLEGSSLIFLQVDPAYLVDDVLVDVRNAVDKVSDFPEEVETPYVQKLDNTQKEFLKVTLTGGDRFILRDEAKRLRTLLERVPGVSKILFGGEGAEEILVSLDANKLVRFEVTSQQVVEAIRSKNLNISAGKIETPDYDISVRTFGEITDFEEIESVIVRSNDSGASVRIGDLGKVSKRIREDSGLQRSDGEPALYVQIRKKPSADILRTTALVKKAVEEHFEKSNPYDLKYRYTDDWSFFVNRRLDVLLSNGKFGFALVFITLLFFLNFRASVFTSMGAPIAFMTAFVVMYSLGMSLNLISMFALILVLGMLVDDSIIVAEHYYQKLEKGMAPLEAARVAAIETLKPVGATIVTTMIAFGSLFFMGGIMGKFTWPIPAVVIICLAISWIECFFILPSHLAEFVRLKKGQSESKRWYDRFKDHYARVLNFCLANSKKIVTLFFILFFGSLLLNKYMKFILFPNDDIRYVKVMLKGKVGQPLSETDQALKTVEKKIFEVLRKDELDQLRTMIGTNISHGGNSRRGNHYGTLLVYLTMEVDRERSTDEIITDIEKKVKPSVPDYTVSVEKMQGGPPKGLPVDIEISGDDLELILSMAKKTLAKLSSLEGVVGPEIDFEEGKKQILVLVDEREAKRLGVTTRSVAMELRRSLAGDSISEIRGSDEDYDIVVQFSKEQRSSKNILDLVYILNDRGQRIKLSQVSKFKEIPGAFVIRRKDGKRVISVSSSLNTKILTPKAAAKQMEPFLADLKKQNPDFFYKFGGESEDTDESMLRLARAGFIAFSLIFIVLVAMFSSVGQSLLVMSAIPLGLIGVILTFFLFNKPFSFMALLGLVGLVGVVVNDSIVLVNFINKQRGEEEDIFKAVLDASVSRFRPVILTTFTTVAGLLPIAHAPGGDPFLKPMALGFAWGLFFSSAVTLIFVPCAYLVYYSIKPYFYFPFHKLSLVFSRGYDTEERANSFAEYQVSIRKKEAFKLKQLMD